MKTFNQFITEANFQLSVDTTVAIKVKGKMLYGKITELEKVQGKPGVVVKWSNGTTGRFKMSVFASVLGDKKADYVVDEATELKWKGDKPKKNKVKVPG